LENTFTTVFLYSDIYAGIRNRAGVFDGYKNQSICLQRILRNQLQHRPGRICIRCISHSNCVTAADRNFNHLFCGCRIKYTERNNGIFGQENLITFNLHLKEKLTILDFIFKSAELNEQQVCANFAHTTHHCAIRGKTQETKDRILTRK